MGRKPNFIDLSSRVAAIPAMTKKPWIPALLILAVPLAGCVSTGSSAGDDGSYYEDSTRPRPPVRSEVGPPPPPPKASLPEMVDTISSRLEKTEDVQRTVASNMERRLGMMEKEVSDLRGEVDVLRYAKARLESELAASKARPAPAPAHVAPDTGNPDYDPVEQGDPGAAANVETPSQPEVVVAKAAPPPVEEKKSKPAAVKPGSSKQAYDDAFLLLKGGRYEESLAAFKNYMEWFPNDSLADNAQYWVGELYYVQRKFPEALMAFNQVLVRWPTSAKVPASLLKIGFSFYELGDMENAKSSLSRLVTDFPDSPAVAMAKQRLELAGEKSGRH